MNRRITFYLTLLLISASSLAGSSYGVGKRVLPHFPRTEGGFKGTLMINNPSNLKKNIVLTCYSIEGNKLGDINLELEPRELQRVAINEVCFKGTSHAVISGSERVSISVAFESSQEDEVRSSAEEVLSQNGEVKVIPSFTASNSTYWDGAAVVNMGDKAGVLMVDIMAEGILGPPGISISIAPMEKKVFTFSSLFGDPTGMEGYYFKVSSDQPFAFMGLAGTTDHKILWPVIPNRVEDFKKSEFSNQSVEDLQVDNYGVEQLLITEEILTVTVAYTEQCAGELKLFMSGSFMESYPVQANLTFQRINEPDQACLDVLTVEEAVFDLAPIVQDYINGYGKDEIILLNIYDFHGDKVQQLEYRPGH